MTTSAHCPCKATPEDNLLLRPWSGPFGGVPPFDKVQIGDFKSALSAAMEDQLAEIATIAKNPAPATFENTILAMERAGRSLDRVSRVFGVYTSTLNSTTPHSRRIYYPTRTITGLN